MHRKMYQLLQYPEKNHKLPSGNGYTIPQLIENYNFNHKYL